MLLGSGCAHDKQYVREGKAYGVTQGTFRARWWNYYERGVSFMDGQFYDEAISDLKRALEDRPTDEWRARSYGLHFVPHFPKRELGICYFETGEFDEAERLLAESLEDVDTARAHHYLDEVHRAKIAKGSLSDDRAPSLEIVPLGLRASRTGTREVNTARAHLKQTGASSTTSAWQVASSRAFRSVGVLFSTLSAALFGAPAETDEAATVIITNQARIPVALRAADDLSVSTISLGNEPVYLRNGGKEVEAIQEVALNEGSNTLVAKANDLSGKEVETSLQIVLDLSAPVISVLDPPPAYATSAATVDVLGSVTDDVGMTEVAFDADPVLSADEFDAGSVPPQMVELAYPGKALVPDKLNLFEIRAVDSAGNETTYAIDIYQGNSRPSASLPSGRHDVVPLTFRSYGSPEEDSRAEIHFDIQSGVRVVSDTLYLQGTARSGVAIAEVRVNGHTIRPNPSPVVRWGRRVPLEVGENRIIVEAIDVQSASSQEELVVERVQSFFESDQGRLGAYLAASDTSDQRAADALDAALRAKGRFHLLPERYAVQERRQALASAKSAGAQALFYAEFTQRGRSMELVVSVVDTESGEVVATLDGQAPDSSDAARVAFEAAGLAGQVEQVYPRVEATLLEAGTLDKGSLAGLRADMRAAVGQPATKTQDFGPVAIVRLIEVGETSSRFEVLEQLADAPLVVGMHAVAL